nr:hypothetical protein [Photobacterium damselae]
MSQIARIDNDKVYQGTSLKQIAHVKDGKVYQGTSLTQIAQIKGAATHTEMAAIMSVVLGLF